MIFEILAAWLLADFITGIFHWWEDRVLVSPSKFHFINKIIFDNEIHHKRPTDMVKKSWYENINNSLPFAVIGAVILLACGCPFVVYMAVYFTGFGNLIHRFAHQPKSQLPWIVRFMQGTGLFITFKHHMRHHFTIIGRIDREDTKIRYCPMTNWVNPILDKIRFFKFLEFIFIRGNRGVH